MKVMARTPFRPDASGVYFLPISFHEKIAQFHFKIFVKSELVFRGHLFGPINRAGIFLVKRKYDDVVDVTFILFFFF